MIRSALTVTAVLLVTLGSFAQRAELVKLEKLQSLITSRESTVQIVNFWATWCGPCVKELPLLEKFNSDHPEMKVTLVSMDLDLDPDPEKVYKFITRKQIQSKVVILDERDANTYINKIDKNWSGALPATLIVNTTTGKRTLWNKELHEGDLEKLVNELK